MDKSDVLRALERHAPTDGVTQTPIPGLRLFRISEPIERLPGVYPTGICAIAQGRKHAYLDGEVHIYDAENYLCCAVPMPVEAEIREATPDEPVLGLLLDIDSPAMTSAVIELQAADTTSIPPSEVTRSLALAPWDDPFTDALARLLSLLDDPTRLVMLLEGRLREVMFAILTGGAGAGVHQAMGASREVSRAVNYLRSHLDEALSVDTLAKRVGMSRAAFHRKFKEATTYSPMQFVKALRLNEAAMLIASGTGVGESAARVGYSSQSQFSREFRRHFGRSPREWSASKLPA